MKSFFVLCQSLAIGMLFAPVRVSCSSVDKSISMRHSWRDILPQFAFNSCKCSVPIIGYTLYNAVVKAILPKTQYLALEIVACTTAINPNPAGKLETLIPRMKRLSGEPRWKSKETRTELWHGPLVNDTRIQPGWYKVGRRVRSTVIIHVDAETLYTRVFIPQSRQAMEIDVETLLKSRKPCSVVEDVAQKVAWQNFLKHAVADDSVSEPPPSSGTYQFVYREYVDVKEEFVAMLACRGVLTKMRFIRDSQIELSKQRAHLSDFFALQYGLLPFTTHNTGSWNRQEIMWEQNRVKIGRKGELVEIPAVTQQLCDSSPAILKFCSPDIMLMSWRGKGWLVWKRINH